jgi:hypothetical protein
MKALLWGWIGIGAKNESEYYVCNIRHRVWPAHGVLFEWPTDHYSRFIFLAEPRLIFPYDLNPVGLMDPRPAVIHLISFPPRMKKVLKQLDEMKAALAARGETWCPKVIWEPDLVCGTNAGICMLWITDVVQESLDVVREVTSEVDVIRWASVL